MTVPAAEATTPRWYTEPRRLAVDGTELAYRRSGTGAPLLFVHGHWLTNCWAPFHATLACRTDLIAVDLPGFGASPCPSWVTGRDDVVLLLRDALDELGLDRVHVAGYGIGAWLAADFAIYNPGRVRALSLIAPFGLRVPGEPIADVFLLDPASYADAYYNGDPGDHRDVVPGPGTPDDGGAEEFARRYGDMGAAARLVWERRYDLKLEHRLPLLRRPAQVVSAADDRIVPAAHPRRWAALLDARADVIAGAGHALLVTHPDETAAAVARFAEEAAHA